MAEIISTQSIIFLVLLAVVLAALLFLFQSIRKSFKQGMVNAEKKAQELNIRLDSFNSELKELGNAVESKVSYADLDKRISALMELAASTKKKSKPKATKAKKKK